MADAFYTVQFQTTLLRRADGLIAGVRVFAPKIADMWLWLNREDEHLEELRPYRVGMFTRQHRG